MMEQEYDTQAPAMPYYPDSTGRADLLDKINPDKVVEVMKNKLMGRELDPKTRKWVDNPILKESAVTELCANEMCNLILSVSNANVSISKLKDQEIRKRAYSITCTAMKMMLAGWVKYGINNTAQMAYVIDIVYSLAFITMKQADNEGIRRMIVGTRSEIHSIQDSPEGQKKGLFGRRK